MTDRILICGDRNWDDEDLIFKALMDHPSTTTVIDGHASGADKLAHFNAERLGMASACFPANWLRYGKAAGPIRNQQMLDEGKPTAVWAFHDHLDISKGTKDMVQRAKHAGVPTLLFSHKNRSGVEA